MFCKNKISLAQNLHIAFSLASHSKMRIAPELRCKKRASENDMQETCRAIFTRFPLTFYSTSGMSRETSLTQSVTTPACVKIKRLKWQVMLPDQMAKKKLSLAARQKPHHETQQMKKKHNHQSLCLKRNTTHAHKHMLDVSRETLIAGLIASCPVRIAPRLIA